MQKSFAMELKKLKHKIVRRILKTEMTEQSDVPQLQLHASNASVVSRTAFDSHKFLPVNAASASKNLRLDPVERVEPSPEQHEAHPHLILRRGALPALPFQHTVVAIIRERDRVVKAEAWYRLAFL